METCMLFSFKLVTIFLTLWTITSCRLLDNVNKAILLNLDEEFASRNISNQRFLEKFVNDLSTLGEDGEIELSILSQQLGSVDELAQICNTTSNITACERYLKENCVSVRQLLQAEESSNIADLFPALVYNLYGSTCRSEELEPKSRHLRHKKQKVPSGQAWGYGLGFVALICCVSNIGGFMAPFMKKDFFQRMLLYCVALAVGTLGSTGLLVLIPESMHLTGVNSPVPDYRFKMGTVMGGIYFFYLSERFLKIWFSRKKKPRKMEKEVKQQSSIVVENGAQDIPSLDKLLNIDNEFTPLAASEENAGKPESKRGLAKRHNKLSTVALMIMIGDALHNFVDGITIGAAFTEDVYLGISVSISVICEELPHELGDIAILLNSGLTMKRSLFVNFLAALTCVIGLVIGILIGENTDANMWIFAVAGGMFVYISLVDMLPEMAEQTKLLEEEGIENKGVAMFIQNLGLITGFVIIMMIAMYGGNISV